MKTSKGWDPCIATGIDGRFQRKHLGESLSVKIFYFYSRIPFGNRNLINFGICYAIMNHIENNKMQPLDRKIVVHLYCVEYWTLRCA